MILLPVLFGGSGDTTVEEQEAENPEEVAEQEELLLLEEVVELIQPERLGVDTDEATIAQELNRWWIQYGPGSEEDSEIVAAHREPLLALLGDDAAQLALDDVFGRRDVAHMTTALAFRLAGLTITTGQADEAEQATTCFYFVIRNIQLDRIAANVSESGWSAAFPYQTLLWGRGRGEDRVWAFAELLRQMRFDSVVVLPADGDAGHPLVAVSVENDLLLYDPILGLPIPSLSVESDETALPETPASFTEALGNDAVFRQLDSAGSPYPWTSEALRNVQLLVVGTDSTFSPRMEALQQMLPSQFSFVVFDGWSASEFRELPLQARLEAIVMELPDVDASLGVWTYPLAQAATYDHDNGLDGEFLTERELWFQAPTILISQPLEDGTTVESHRPADRTVQTVRSTHIEGDFTEAMKGYLPMRNAYLQYRVSENGRAAEVAVFWSALCQFEFGRPDLAALGFRDYLRDYGTGHFAKSAGYWLAVSHAANGDVTAAVETLQSPALQAMPAGHIEYLARRWSPPTSLDETASPIPTDDPTVTEETEEIGTPQPIDEVASPEEPSANVDET